MSKSNPEVPKVEEQEDVAKTNATTTVTETENTTATAPILPQRRVEPDANYTPAPTETDADGNKVHTSISDKWKVYDNEPVAWTDEERQV